MGSPYRHDPLRERRATITRALAELEAQLAELAAERARLRVALDAIEQRLGASRGLLDDIRVASPCGVDWSTMTGDDRVRMCATCNKNVYDLSAMTEAEALELLDRGGDTCVRFYRRADGRVLTADCPVGAHTKRKRRLKIVAAASAPLLASTLAAAWAGTANRDARPHPTAAEIDHAFMNQGYFTQGYLVKDADAGDRDE
ncbi:MAG: hypothetical protein KF819_05295 [Labilithrix sp.]|nr:hypothetical protein [Labilithrix sp.]